jgi:SNF2 family DNA or RNA helicase
VICFSRRRNALLLDCGHMFTCGECFSRMQQGIPKAKWTCPICRQKVRKVVTVGKGGAPSDAMATTSKRATGGKLGRSSILQNIKVEQFASSTKIEALATELKRIRRQRDPAKRKSIVFSQYNRMIDLCEFRLKQLGLHTVKLMGYMPMKERRSVLHAFKTRPEIDVILMSLKVCLCVATLVSQAWLWSPCILAMQAGGEGLNLQEAAQVFILDPWWNPQVEAQAIQRAHRLGQKHDVSVGPYAKCCGTSQRSP